MNRLEYYALMIWERLPLWIRDAAPLPVIEWVQAAPTRAVAEAITALTLLTPALRRMSDATKQATDAFEQLGAVYAASEFRFISRLRRP